MAKLHAAILILLTLGGCAAHVADDADAEVATLGATDVDLFAGDMPDLLVDAHARQLGGELLELDIQHELYDYATATGDDARPWILLARDSMRREEGGIAVSQYTSAIEADPRAAAQSGVLDDLITVAATHGARLERGAASTLIVDAYGAGAQAAVKLALSNYKESGNQAAVEHLTALQESLAE